jgi:hypothetical protein
MGRALSGEDVRDPVDDYLETGFAAWESLAGGNRSPPVATTSWPCTRSRAAADDPLRRPSGYGADRRA